MKNSEQHGQRNSSHIMSVRILLLILAISSILISLNASSTYAIEIKDISMPASIAENSLLEMSFTASSNISKIEYKILKNGIPVSNNNSYEEFLNYGSQGTYEYRFIASDANSSISAGINLTVEDIPLDISIVEPQSKTYTAYSIGIFVNTNHESNTTCNYTAGSYSETLGNSETGEFEGEVALNGDGKYTLMISCMDDYDIAYDSVNFSINTTAPKIISKTYNIANDYTATLRAETSEAAVCRYSSSDVSFDAMAAFSFTSGFIHTTTTGVLDDGSHNFYIKCRNNNGLIASDVIFFTISQRPAASVTIERKSPLKAGTYKVNVKTSKEVQSSPLFWYILNDESGQKNIVLSGSGKEWEGYMIIPEDSPNKVGAFKFSGTDFNGLTGTVITSGELFLVDTTKPQPISDLKAASEEDGDIVLEWYYDKEEVELFNIYRSMMEDVGHMDYYDSKKASRSKNFDYTDRYTVKGEKYYYRITPVDEAGNEGEFSPAISADVITLETPNRPLDSSLVPKVNNKIREIERMILDISTGREYLRSISDNQRLKLITVLRLNEKIDFAENSLNSLKTQSESLKSEDINSAELDVRLNRINLDALKAQSRIVEELSVEEYATFEQLTQDSDVEKNIRLMTEGINLSKKSLKEYSDLSTHMQDSLTINGEMISFKIKYFNKDDYERRTFISKQVHSSVALEDVIILENIPKEVERKASNIDSSISDFSPKIIKEDPILGWELSSLESTSISYIINSIVDSVYVKNSRTIVLKKPDFQYSDTIIDGNAGITGMFSFDTVSLSNLQFIHWAMILGVLIVIVLSLYYFVTPETFAGGSGDKNIRDSAGKKSSRSIKDILGINARRRIIAQKGAIMPVPKPPIRPPIHIDDNIKNRQEHPRPKFMTQKSLLLNNVDYCNHLINNLDYENARNVYKECMDAFKTLDYDKDMEDELKETLAHIYDKMQTYRYLHEARKHLYYKSNDKLESALKNVNDNIKKVLSRLERISEDQAIHEKNFIYYIVDSRDQIIKYKSS